MSRHLFFPTLLVPTLDKPAAYEPMGLKTTYCDTVDGVEFGRFVNYDIVPEDRSGHLLDRKTSVRTESIN
jgi:hypothetical protein